MTKSEKQHPGRKIKTKRNREMIDRRTHIPNNMDNHWFQGSTLGSIDNDLIITNTCKEEMVDSISCAGDSLLFAVRTHLVTLTAVCAQL